MCLFTIIYRGFRVPEAELKQRNCIAPVFSLIIDYLVFTLFWFYRQKAK